MEISELRNNDEEISTSLYKICRSRGYLVGCTIVCAWLPFRLDHPQLVPHPLPASDPCRHHHPRCRDEERKQVLANEIRGTLQPKHSTYYNKV